MSGFASGSLLAQVRPGVTTAVEAFAATLRTEVMRIVVCNTTGSAANFSLFHDDAGGSTFDQTTALHYVQSVPANSTIEIVADAIGGGIMLNIDGQIGVQSGTASALTYSIYGVTANIATPLRQSRA